MKRLTLVLTLLLSLSLFATTVVHGNSSPAPVSQATLARYADELLERNHRADGPGAGVLVARGDQVLFRAARGEADIDAHVPLRPDALFRIGSMSKQFAAAGLLKLVEAGKVKLDDPLSRYVADFPGGDRISVLQLLNHTSGVKSYTALPGYMDSTIRKDMTTAQLIDTFRREAPDFAPGTSWAYSNSSYVLVGAVIEAASGQPWHAYLEEVLFKPLGMHHTGYGNDPRFAARVIHGYSYDGDKVVPRRPLSMTQPHAAGALVSNVDDLLTWNRALHEGRVLRPATYAQMITPVGKAAERGAGYGFGLFRDSVRTSERIHHGGRIFGFISTLSYLPGPDITVVVLENDDSNNGPDPAATMACELAAMASGEPYPALKAIPVDLSELGAAEGVYRFAVGITRVLRLVDAHLTAQRSPRPRQILTPIASDDYLYPDGFNRIKLERDAGGRISGMRFLGNGDGVGELGVRTNDSLPAEPVAVQIPRAALERLAGTYANGGLTLKVYLDGEALKAQLPGQPPVSLRATSPTRFEVQEAEASLAFATGDSPAAEVVMRQNGRELVLKRAP